MAQRDNLIATYQSNPTLQSRYTQQQYLDMFGFGANQPQPDPDPDPDPNPPAQNIIGSNLNQGSGGQGIQGLQQTFTRTQPRAPKFDPNINPAAFLTGKGRLDPMGSTYDNLAMMGPLDFKTQKYHMSEIPGQEGYQAPSKYFEEPSMFNKGITAVKDFFTDSKFFQPRVQGTLGTRLANQPQLPGFITALAGSRSPFNKASPTYNPNLVSELNYLEGLGPEMIGRDPNSGLLKYGSDSVLSGKNVISGFGTNSYAKALDNYIDKVTNKYNEIVDKYGVDSDKAVNYKLKFVDKSIKEREKNTANAIKIAKDAEEAAALTAAASRAESARQYDSNVHGPTNYGLGSDGKQSYSAEALGAKDQGFGVNATSGGPVSNRTGKGRTDYDDGGMVYLYDRQEMSNGGSTNGSYEAALRKKIEELMDDGYEFGEAVREAMRQGYDNGGPISESDFPFLIKRPGENMGRRKPGLSDYDLDTQDYDDDDMRIIEIPMGKMMKKKTKKKKKDREDYSDGGRVYLYDRQD